MAKIIVAIDVPDISSKMLRQEMRQDYKKKEIWFSEDDGDRIIINRDLLRRSCADANGFYSFELKGVE